MAKQEKSDTNEVQALQREAEQLRSQRKRSAAPPPEPAPKEAAVESGTAAPCEATEASDSEWGAAVGEFSGHLNKAAKEIDQAVREHPGLALLTVFAGGMLVGHLYTRR